MPIDAKTLSRTTLLLGGQTILKFEPAAGGLVKIIYRLAVGGSLPFQNEMNCYSANPDSFHGTEIPKGAKLILIHYEEPTGTAKVTDVTFNFISQVFNIISSLKGHSQFGPIKSVLFWLINGPVPRSLRDLKRSQSFSITEKFRLVGHLLWLQVKQKRFTSGYGQMIHNDLMLHNILKFGETIKVIDFEDSLIEKKWVFADVTDLLFQSKNWSRSNVLQTLRQLGENHGDTWSETELQNHFTYGLLRFFIRSTVMTRRSETDKVEAAKQIREWLDGL